MHYDKTVFYSGNGNISDSLYSFTKKLFVMLCVRKISKLYCGNQTKNSVMAEC